MEAELRLQLAERKMQLALDEKRIEMDMQLRAVEEEAQKLLQEKILKQRKEQVDRMRANQESFRKQMADLDKAMLELSSVDVPKKDPGTVDDTGNGKGEIFADDESSDDDDDFEDDLDQKGQGSGLPGEIKTSTPQKKTADATTRTGPTKAQLAARKGLTYKLKKFSGKPAEWPLFYASYTASNDACGYMNHENLIRLQECLDGDALELVEGQLLLPESVPEVIKKLQRHFGRPEQILQSLLDKVNRLDPPKADCLRSFIPFATAVEQLCGHLEAAGLHQHLFNPLLVKNLVAKLPDREKREWVRYQRGQPSDVPTLRTFTNWLIEFDEDACAADVDMEPHPLLQPKGGPASGNRKQKQEGSLHYHSEVRCSETNASKQKKLLPCRLCQSIEHRLRHCPSFKEMPFAERQVFVNREKLCSVCLNGHGGRCIFNTRCNVSDCKEHHHPLMHPEEGVIGMSAHIHSDYQVMFRMIPVQLHYGGETIKVLAFLDEGASVTLMEQNLADKLGIVGVQEPLTIRWSANVSRDEKGSRRMNIWASGVGAEVGDKLLLNSVRTVGKMMLPRQKMDYKGLAAQHTHMRDLLVDSYDGQPKLLIGLNNLHAFTPDECKKGNAKGPIAVRCPLGWTIYGPRAYALASATNFVGYHNEVEGEQEFNGSEMLTPFESPRITLHKKVMVECVAAVPVTPTSSELSRGSVATEQEGVNYIQEIDERSASNRQRQGERRSNKNVVAEQMGGSRIVSTIGQRKYTRSENPRSIVCSGPDIQSQHRGERTANYNKRHREPMMMGTRGQHKERCGVRYSVSPKVADVTGGGVKTPHVSIPSPARTSVLTACSVGER